MSVNAVSDNNETPIRVEDLVRLMFRSERETTALGRTLQQMTDTSDTREIDFHLVDDVARDDFVQFLMSELHSAYETIVLLAMEIDRIKALAT